MFVTVNISVCNTSLLHASKVDSDVAVVCKDTDVRILMIWTLKDEHKKWLVC